MPQDTNSNSNLYERIGGSVFLLPAQNFFPVVYGVSRSGKRLVTLPNAGASLQILFTGPYVRPLGASPLRVALVPAYAECTAPDLVHGPPLEHGSCGSPQQASVNLTVGTPESNGATANSTGSVRLNVLVGSARAAGRLGRATRRQPH